MSGESGPFLVEVLVAAEPEVVEVLAPADPEVIEVEVPGIPGPAGPPGTSAALTIEAATVLSGHRVVRAAVDGARVASAAEATHLGTVIGITVSAAVQGADATVQTAGPLDEPSWAWTPGPVFLGLDGLLTQSPQPAAFIQQVGVAVAPTRLVVALLPPIRTL